MSLLELLEGIQDLIGSLGDGETPHVPGIIDPGSEGVDLADCEPGQGGEDKVEKSLPTKYREIFMKSDYFKAIILRNIQFIFMEN